MRARRAVTHGASWRRHPSSQCPIGVPYELLKFAPKKVRGDGIPTEQSGGPIVEMPSKEATGGVMHWDSLRSTPEKVRAHMHALEAEFSAAENDGLSQDGKRAKLHEIGRKALSEFSKLKGTPDSVTRRQARLVENMAEELSKGKSEYAEEIRAWVAKSEKPMLSADEQETLRNQFFANTAPGKEAAEIEAALGVCGGAVRSAEAMICERAQIKPDGSDNLT